MATKFDAAMSGFDLTENLYHTFKNWKATEKQKNALNCCTRWPTLTLEIIKCYPWFDGRINFIQFKKSCQNPWSKSPNHNQTWHWKIEDVFACTKSSHVYMWWQNLTMHNWICTICRILTKEMEKSLLNGLIWQNFAHWRPNLKFDGRNYLS